jgi:hypothetical protein
MQPLKFASRRIQADEITLDYHRQLIDTVDGDCVLKVLESQLTWFRHVTDHLSTEQIDRIHSPYQWTIRQVIEHCADAERVFGYRMLRVAAGDPTDLPTWNENAYADARFGLGIFAGLCEELLALRLSNLCLLRRIVPAAWDRAGTISGNRITTRGLAWVSAGHLQHHLRIVEGRVGMQHTSHTHSA